MKSKPAFAPIAGSLLRCDIQRCPNDATNFADWGAGKTKRVCTTHKKQVQGSNWSDVINRFGCSQPPLRGMSNDTGRHLASNRIED